MILLTSLKSIHTIITLIILTYCVIPSFSITHEIYEDGPMENTINIGISIDTTDTTNTTHRNRELNFKNPRNHENLQINPNFDSSFTSNMVFDDIDTSDLTSLNTPPRINKYSDIEGYLPVNKNRKKKKVKNNENVGNGRKIDIIMKREKETREKNQHKFESLLKKDTLFEKIRHGEIIIIHNSNINIKTQKNHALQFKRERKKKEKKLGLKKKLNKKKKHEYKYQSEKTKNNEKQDLNHILKNAHIDSIHKEISNLMENARESPLLLSGLGSGRDIMLGEPKISTIPRGRHINGAFL